MNTEERLAEIGRQLDDGSVPLTDGTWHSETRWLYALVRELQAEVGELKADVNQDIEELQADVEGMGAAFLALTTRLNAAESRVAELQAENERMEGIVDSYVAQGPTDREAQDMFIEEHNKAVRLEADLARLQEENEGLDEALATANHSIPRLRKLAEGSARKDAALQAIIDYTPPGFISPMDDEDSMNYRAIACAALEGDPK